MAGMFPQGFFATLEMFGQVFWRCRGFEMSAETLELGLAWHRLPYIMIKHLAKIAKWTHWDLNPGPSACEADVIPLHHVPHWDFKSYISLCF